MLPTITITETGPANSELTASNVRDLAHIRRLLLQSTISVEYESIIEHEVPMWKLHLLRGFLDSVGVGTKEKSRRLLLMALLQLEDEDETKRLVLPQAILPAIARQK